MRRLVPPGLLARLWMDRGIASVVVLIVLVTSGTASSVGRSLDRLTGISLQDEVANAAPSVVGITSSMLVDRELGDPGLFTTLTTRGLEVRDGLPAPLSDLMEEPGIVVDSVRFQLVSLEGDDPLPLPTNLTFRAQAAGSALTVDGAVPTAPTRTYDVPSAAVGQPGREVPVHEITLSRTTSERTGIDVGRRLLAVPDPSDPLARRAGIISLDPIAIEVVGFVDLSPADEPVWWGDPRLHRPSQIDTGTSTTYFAFGWVPPEAAGVLPGAGDLPAQVDWRFPIVPAALADVDADRALDAAQALAATNAGLSADFSQIVSTSRLDRVLGDEAVRRGVAFNVLRLGMVAVAGVGVAVLGLLAILLDERRRGRTALTMGRGGSRGQLLLGASMEAAGLSLVGAAAGLLVAIVVIPGAVGVRDLAVAGGIGVASSVALGAGGTRAQRRPLRELLQSESRSATTPLRGLVLEGAIVLVAVVGVFALRDRGVDASEPDPFVVLVPVLVALAAGLVVRRLHRLPIRAAASAAGRRRGVAMAIGFLRGARQDLAGPMVVVVVLAVAVTIFASAVTTTIARGQAVAAWEDVGASWRIDASTGGSLPPFEAAGVTVVDAFVGDAAMNSGGAAFGRGDVIAADLAALDGLLADGPAPVRFPPRLLVDVPTSDGGATPIVPAVVSTTWFNNERLRINDQVDVTFGTRRLTYQVVAVRERLLGLDADDSGPFMIVPRSVTEAVIGSDLATTTQFVGGSVTRDQLVESGGPDAVVTSREDVEAALASRVLARGVALGFVVMAVTALLFAALALVVWQALTGRDRVRDLAVLSALGTSRRARFALAMAEGVPAVVIAIVGGSFVGRVVGDLLDGVIDLGPFTGTPTVDDVVSTAALTTWGTLGLVVVAVLLVAALTWRGERVTTSRLLRQD